MTKEEMVVTTSANNNGLLCPFKLVLCQEGYCHECRIYLDWQRKKSGSVKEHLLGEVTQ